MNKYYDIILSEAKKGAQGAFADPTLGTKIIFDEDYKKYGLPAATVRNDKSEINAALNEAAEAYSEVTADHPELFWLSDSCRTSYITRGDTAYIYVDLYCENNIMHDPVYDIRRGIYDSTERILDGIARRDAYIAGLLAEYGISSHNPADKNVSLINRALVTTNQFYSGNGSNLAMNDSTSCMSALAGSTGDNGPLCTGYAKAFKVLCDRVGIPCRLVLGTAAPAGVKSYAHMWNAVNIGGAWYGVDVTWNDPYTRGTVAESGYENENYLLVGSETVIDGQPFGESHISNSPVLNARSFK